MTAHRPSLRRTLSRLRPFAAMAALASAGLLLAACAGGVGGSAGGSTSTDPVARFVGTWGNTSPQRPYLTFKSDKSVSGSDGCNRIVTTYTVSGDTATLKPAATTLMACTGVDPWLAKVHTVTISGNTLVVKDSQGAKIGTLDRVGG